MSLLALGINHKTASVDVREKASLVPEQIEAFLHHAKQNGIADEVVVLSTCNRTEFYIQNLRSTYDEFIEVWANHSNLEASEIREYLYELKNDEMVFHLFEVASGLDSLILGEPQIFGQLKQSLANSVRHGMVSKYLQRLFQLSFFVAKRVRTETNIGAFAVSVAFTAVQLAKQIFDGLERHHVLLVGAGETTELVARHLLEAGVTSIDVANRSLDRAETMIENLGLKSNAYTLDEIPELLSRADIVVSSTAANHALITKEMAKAALKKRRNKPILMIDLAVPRDIEAAIGSLSDIYLYTVDDLNSIVEDNQKSREEAAEEAKAFLHDGLARWNAWYELSDLGEVLTPLQAYAEEKRAQGVRRAKSQLAAGHGIDEVLDQLSNQLLGRVLHPLVSYLKKADDDTHEAFLKKIQDEFK